MFYSGNDNYMQDLYFYNQTPNNTYNPYMNGCGNGAYSQNPMYQNPNMFNNMNQVSNSNITSFYPSIYKIINPVVSRVVQNSNYQFLNEDTLNNMVETVYSIVDGQIEYGDEQVGREIQNSTNSTQTSTQNTVKATEPRQTTNMNNSNFQNSRNDCLLKDIIKILIIKELLSRNNYPNRQFYCNNGIPQNNLNF